MDVEVKISHLDDRLAGRFVKSSRGERGARGGRERQVGGKGGRKRKSPRKREKGGKAPQKGRVRTSFQPQQQSFFSSREKILLGLGILHSETDVHPAARGLVVHRLIDVGVRIQDAIESLRLGVRDGLLPGKARAAMGREEALHDLPGDPDGKNGHRVIQRSTLGDDRPVQDRRRTRMEIRY